MNSLEVGIADFGVGLLGSYNNNSDKDILSHLEAMQAASHGISTKNLPEAENRGFGIITSGNMIIEGLDGIYNMISGNTMFMKKRKEKKYLVFSQRIIFNGTIVIFNIPLHEHQTFNYINYLE